MPDGFERPKRLVGTGIERQPVRRDVHPGVERQAQRRGAERTQVAGQRPNLGRIHASRGDQHLAVVQGRYGRIPAAGCHVRAERPGVCRRIEEVGLDDAVQLLVLVPTGHEHPAVDEMGQPAAEDVEAGVDVDRRLGAGDRIPDGRSCVVLHGIRLGRVVADRVVRENLAVRKQCNVHSDDRPIDDRTPLADVLSTPAIMAAAALAYLALTARVCASSVRSCLAVSTTASSAAWPAGVMIPSCAPAPGARCAAMRTDAMNKTPDRDMYLPPLGGVEPEASGHRAPFLLAVGRGLARRDQVDCSSMRRSSVAASPIHISGSRSTGSTHSARLRSSTARRHGRVDQAAP